MLPFRSTATSSDGWCRVLYSVSSLWGTKRLSYWTHSFFTVNDFPSILLYLMYTDDRALTFIGDSLNEIEDETNEELQRVHSWFKGNHLNINMHKTKYVVFHSRKKQLDFGRFNLLSETALVATSSFI